MSGPKSSRYTLTPEQQKLLAQRLTIVQKLRALQIRYRSELCTFGQFGGEIEKCTERMRTAALLCGADSTAFDALLQEYGEAYRACQGLDLVSICRFQPDEVALTQTANALWEEISTQQMPAFEAQFESLRKRLTDLHRQIAAADAENQRLIRTHMQEFAAKADTDFTAVTRVVHVQYREQRQRLADQLAALAAEAPAELQKQVQGAQTQLAACSDTASLRNLEALVIAPLKKRCAEFAAHKEEFRALSAEYEALTGAPPAGYSCTAEGIAALRQTVSDAERAAAYAAEQQYIRQCIDTVMEQMGYTVLASRSRTRRNGRTVRNMLVQFDADTALCITQTDDGRITMEIGGLDDRDRQPDDAESERLCGEMEAFCGSYTEIEARLREMGVVTQHIQLLPPAPAYAQIINCSDFGISLPARGQTARTAKKPDQRRAE